MTKMVKPIASFVLLLVSVTFAAAAMVQNPTGSIGGLVMDPTGAVVVGAEITVVNVQTGLTRKTTTSAEGVYSFPNLTPGQYELEIGP